MARSGKLIGAIWPQAATIAHHKTDICHARFENLTAVPFIPVSMSERCRIG